jgi:hypothetical protein
MFKTPSGQRLAIWKKFRFEINSLPVESAVCEVNEFWSKCPFIPFYLDPNDSKSWPNPWELIQENYYCDLAKSLGIIYTLHLTNHGILLDPQLRIYLNKKTFDYKIK